MEHKLTRSIFYFTVLFSITIHSCFAMEDEKPLSGGYAKVYFKHCVPDEEFDLYRTPSIRNVWGHLEWAPPGNQSMSKTLPETETVRDFDTLYWPGPQTTLKIDIRALDPAFKVDQNPASNPWIILAKKSCVIQSCKGCTSLYVTLQHPWLSDSYELVFGSKF